MEENPDSWRDDGTCSYCGSLAPEAFFAAVERGDELVPTDKDYKAYVLLKEPEPDKLRVVGVTSDDLPEDRRVGWEPADPAVLQADGYGRSPNYRWMLRKPRGLTRQGKFYFQHLDDAGKRRFIELVNTGRMKLGYPGHFYQMPFFCRRAPAE